MNLFSSFGAYWSTRLLAALATALVTVAATVPARAATTSSADQPLVMSYTLPAKPSGMLRAPLATWTPLLAQVGAALDDRAKVSDLLAKPALIELNVQRTVLFQAQHVWPAVFDAVKKTQELQTSEVAKHTAGLLNEVLAHQAASGGDAAWLQRHLRDKVLAMPWTEVESTIRTLRQQLASMNSNAIEAYVINQLDVSAAVSENRGSLSFVMQVLAMRFQLLEVMPRQNALIAGLDEAIAQRSSAADAASTVGK